MISELFMMVIFMKKKMFRLNQREYDFTFDVPEDICSTLIFKFILIKFKRPGMSRPFLIFIKILKT